MNGKLVIRDEIYGNIEVEGIYKELIESEEFQRLKDIIQTGTSYLEFKELKDESRFDHSVGSYYLMCKIIDSIEKKLSIHGIKISQEEKDIAKFAMLLHDIGHGAYSHTLEIITGYSHEKRGINIIKDENTQIHKILNKYGEGFANKVGDFLENVYEHNKTDKGVKIQNGYISMQKLFSSLMSNNIDADRLDFLVRDSKKARYTILTDADKIIENFEIVLDVDRVIVATPLEHKLQIDMAILQRARNYRDIYYCTASVIADNIFEILIQELRENKQDIPEDVNPVIKRFLTNKEDSFTNEEYMQITETPIMEALNKISKNTKNEKIKELCDIEYITDSYKSLDTEKDASYIKYLLAKAIPEISEKDTNSVIEETRYIKPYKSNENENINIITSRGIEDYKDLECDLISLEKFPKKTIAISEEMIRLELGITKDEYDKKYKNIVQEVISNVTKPKDEFELRYVIAKDIINAKQIKEKIEEKYEIIDSAVYMSSDVYYDNTENYELLKERKSLRIREGITLHDNQETYKFKKTRATFKKYKKEVKSDFTIRRKEERIGDSTNIGYYKEFLDEIGIQIDKVKPVLDVKNVRYLYTIKVNGLPIDISFNIAQHTNRIYKTSGNVGIIEVKPRNDKVCDRLSLLEVKEYIESKFPDLTKFVSNANEYEIAMFDTYRRYSDTINPNKVKTLPDNNGDERQ